MPRRARLSIPGILWHIIQRGNNRNACFYAEEDYRRYLDTLGILAPKYGCAVHAYVLMTNHVHLLITPERADSAALLMKHLGQRYVQYVNRRYRRSGTLCTEKPQGQTTVSIPIGRAVIHAMFPPAVFKCLATSYQSHAVPRRSHIGGARRNSRGIR